MSFLNLLSEMVELHILIRCEPWSMQEFKNSAIRKKEHRQIRSVIHEKKS